MPVLPIIDLLILSGWTALMFGAGLKAIDLTTRYHPSIAGLTSMDFAVIAGVCFGFALTLAARTWVRLNEPRLVALRRSQAQAEARRRVREMNGQVDAPADEAQERRVAAGADPS